MQMTNPNNQTTAHTPVRTTSAAPGNNNMISVIDVVSRVMNSRKAATQYIDKFCRRNMYPDIVQGISHLHKFPGRGQKETRVASMETLIMLLNVLPGQQAAHIRKWNASIVSRVIAGDATLVSEIERNRALRHCVGDGKAFAREQQSIGSFARFFAQ